MTAPSESTEAGRQEPTQEPATPAIVALAGRRVDAKDADYRRFPLENVPLVQERIAAMLVAEGAEALVCSAACGADLVALAAAERLGLRRRIVLPFGPDEFRETSVTDRPGDWASLFDRQIAAARDAGDLVVLEVGDGDAAYTAANEAIISEAQMLAAGSSRRRVAIVAWEGGPRDGTDATKGCLDLAVAAGFEQRSVSTL